MEKTPRSGEIFYLTKDKPYQIITMGINKETCENMVIYQALFGDYSTYVLPLAKFMEEVQGEASKLHTPIKDRLKEDTYIQPDNEQSDMLVDDITYSCEVTDDDSHDKVNKVLLRFLDEASYTGKLEVITDNIKAIDDRLINDMAASLDCTVDDGPVDQRLHGLIYCLKQLSRFEVNRLR